MISRQAGTSESETGEQVFIEGASTFQQRFEENLNRELVIASLDEEPLLSGATSQAGEASSSGSGKGLARGLQIPSKAKSPTSGFEYPSVLEEAGISRQDWKRFTDEVQSHASMTRKQWLDTIGTATGTVFIGSLMVRRQHEKQNIKAANASGALMECIQRWNKDFFFQRDLAVRVDVPGSATDMEKMDILPSKVHKEHVETTSISTQSSSLGPGRSDSVTESRTREAAAGRVRIVLMPLDDAASTAKDTEQMVLLQDEQEAATK